MRILLFRPNSEVLTALPPLGLMSLSAYLREFGKHEVRVYDGRLYCATNADIAQKVEEFQPDIVGVGLLSLERQVGHNALKYIRKNFPHLTLLMGGPYPTSEPKDAMENPALDFAVQGEGEIIASNLLNCLQKGDGLRNVKGIAYRANGDVALNPPEDFIKDLDTLPQIAWDLITLPDYFQGKGRSTQMNLHKKYLESAPMQISRGCPYQCTYCHNLMGKQIRYRSIERILEEMWFLKKTYGVKEIELVDDAFNLDIKYATQFFQSLVDSNINLNYSFPNGLRADRMTTKLVDLMKTAGVYRLVYAIETGSPRMQKLVKKNLNLDKAQEMITYTAKKGISVGSFYMLGFLDETEEEMRMTLNFAFKSKAHTASFFLLNPFPNTEIYNQAVKAGFNLDDSKFSHYYSLSSNISRVPSQKILKLRNYAYRRFFLNPIRMLRFFLTTPTKIFFFKKVLIALFMFIVQVQEEKRSPIGGEKIEGIYKHGLLMRLIYRGSGLEKLEKESLNIE
jgi:radical SAM superfamily enzyme YgiQ (UPF0313 family)